MSIDPFGPFGLDTQQRQADRIAGLERRIRALETAGGLRRRVEALGEVSTASTAYVSLGGPAVTLEVPTESFVGLFIELELRVAAGGGAYVGLYEATDQPAATMLAHTTSATYVPAVSGSFTTLRATPGRRTYELVYRVDNAAFPGYYRNRRIWAFIF